MNMNEFVPSEFNLSQNYPNPFREKTTIKYCVAYKTRVQLIVYNSENEVISKLVDEEKKPGTYEVEFDAPVCHSRERRNIKKGEFYYCLKAGDYSSEKKMILENESSHTH
jgi:hypothetical protein